jgi:hypothetical protein
VARNSFVNLSVLCGYRFSGLDDFAAAQAGGADAHALGSALHFGANRAQVDVPAPTRHVVGVADGISELRPSAADITDLCHDCSREVQNLMRKT